MDHVEWRNLTPKKAIAMQKKLRQQVSLAPLSREIRTIAGLDVSMNLYARDAYAGIIVFSYPSLERVTFSIIKGTVEFPYVPGLLSFREIPLLFDCFQKLSIRPDIMMVDGQGIAHPRRLGIATHFGLLTGIPTIGCAKSVLYGSGREPVLSGQSADLFDPKTREKIGTLLKTKERAKPLVISPGHLVSFEDSIQVVRKCLRGYRLPEPTRQAHILVNKFRTGEFWHEGEKNNLARL